jgi:hypothetical protein
MNGKIITVIFLLLLSAGAKAQHRDDDLVQFSGIIVTADSLRPVAFTHILVEKTNRGTTSDYFGYFSIVVHKSDVIHFSAIGYKKVEFRIPDTLSVNRYSLIQVMTNDTIMLAETVIYPWPTKQQFREAFIKLKVPDDDLETIRKNMAYMEIRDRRGKNYNPELYGMDAAMNYRNYVDNYTDKLYYAGQAMPNNLLNPLAWAKFIQAWKRGDFKKKD